MTKKLGIAIAGCGEISVAHGKAHQELADECEIVAMMDVVEPLAQRRAQEFGVDRYYTSFEDMLADKRVDIVDLCTPHFLHAPLAISAANAGKHVLVEKPMCMNTGEVEEMVYAAHKNGVRLAVVTERVNPRHRFIKEHVIPAIGEIQFSYLVDFYFRNMPYYEKAKWRGTFNREGGGIFVNQAIYTWDPYQWFMGGVDTAYGYWTNVLHPNIEVEDIGYGLVNFRNGSHGKIFATSICEAPEDTMWMRIIGSEGEVFTKESWLYSIEFSLNDKGKERRLREEMDRYLGTLDSPGLRSFPVRDESHSRRVVIQMHDLIQAIHEEREVTIDASSSGEAMKILNGIHWGGWNQTAAFKDWAFLECDLPKGQRAGARPTADDAIAQDWRGGKLVETLLGIVHDPARTLERPFQ